MDNAASLEHDLTRLNGLTTKIFWGKFSEICPASCTKIFCPKISQIFWKFWWVQNFQIFVRKFLRSQIFVDRICLGLTIFKPELFFSARNWNVEELPAIEEPWTARDISDKVNMLQKIAVNLRQKRVDSGAMRIDQPKICFTLDKETWLPTVITQGPLLNDVMQMG